MTIAYATAPAPGGNTVQRTSFRVSAAGCCGAHYTGTILRHRSTAKTHRVNSVSSSRDLRPTHFPPLRQRIINDIIRRLLGDRDVVRVTFGHARVTDSHEPRVLSE